MSEALTQFPPSPPRSTSISSFRPCVASKHAPLSILLTGGAGFIGSHTAHALLIRGDKVVVVDEMNDYYDTMIKRSNVKLLESTAISLSGHASESLTDGVRVGNSYRFVQADITDRRKIAALLEEENCDAIVHLAARAGVRASIQDPDEYVHSNILGTTVLLDLMRRNKKIRHMVYASSSSVYGKNSKIPFAEDDVTDDPVSPYAATKKACECMAAAYANMFSLQLTGLRFFTVYGPRGRPDMAPFKFIDTLARGQTIQQYGDGSSYRDYTYISDIVDGIIGALDRPLSLNSSRKLPLHTIYNLGNSSPTTLVEFISTIEKVTGLKAKLLIVDKQTGDVDRTFADVRKSAMEIGYNPKVPLELGISKL